jgi:hypothetical protein
VNQQNGRGWACLVFGTDNVHLHLGADVGILNGDGRGLGKEKTKKKAGRHHREHITSAMLES